VVVADGKDDMIFSTRKEAAVHDKMLEIAERLFALLQTAEISMAEETLEALTWFMAQHRADIGTILHGRRRKTPAGSTPYAPAFPQDTREASPASAPKRRKAVPSAPPTPPPAAA
jgi:hypothetical protein